jgi:PBP1b-binding outer membrane lipoprotein LpoB
MTKSIAVAILAMLLAGCSAGPKAGGRTLTEAQRDSVLGRYSPPVGRALDATAGEAKRAADMNAAVDSMPH